MFKNIHYNNLFIFLQKLHQPVNNIPQQDIEIKNNSTMFNPALYNPTMVQAVAEQQSRFYNQFYRTMAIAAVQQQQQNYQVQTIQPGKSLGQALQPVII